MSLLQQRKAYATALHDSINNPPTHIVNRAANYNLGIGTAPYFIQFDGTTSRLAVQRNAGSTNI